MTKDGDRGEGKGKDREAQLAAALRANLRRRKAGPPAKGTPAPPSKTEEDNG